MWHAWHVISGCDNGSTWQSRVSHVQVFVAQTEDRILEKLLELSAKAGPSEHVGKTMENPNPMLYHHAPHEDCDSPCTPFPTLWVVVPILTLKTQECPDPLIYCTSQWGQIVLLGRRLTGALSFTCRQFPPEIGSLSILGIIPGAWAPGARADPQLPIVLRWY